MIYWIKQNRTRNSTVQSFSKCCYYCYNIVVHYKVRRQTRIHMRCKSLSTGPKVLSIYSNFIQGSFTYGAFKCDKRPHAYLLIFTQTLMTRELQSVTTSCSEITWAQAAPSVPYCRSGDPSYRNWPRVQIEAYSYEFKLISAVEKIGWLNNTFVVQIL